MNRGGNRRGLAGGALNGCGGGRRGGVPGAAGMEALEPRRLLSGLLLTPTITGSTLPASVDISKSARGTVTVELADNGSAPVREKLYVAIVPSTTGTYSEQMSIAEIRKNVTVQPGTPTTVKVPVRINPGDVVPGSYSLLAVVGDSTGTSPSAAGPALTVTGATSTLSETLIRSTAPGTIIAGSKGRGTLTLKVTNTGSATVYAPRGTIVVPAIGDYPGNTNNPEDDTGIVTKNEKFDLAPGKSRIFHLKLGVQGEDPKDKKAYYFPPDNVFAGGSYQIDVAVDATNGSGALTLATLQTVVNPTVALNATVKKDSLPAAVSSASRGSLELAITNSGNVPNQALVSGQVDLGAPGNVTVALLATPSGGGSAITVASEEKKLKIGAGATIPFSLKVRQIPSSLASGSYTLEVQVTDPNGNVTDTSAGSLTVS